MSPSINLSEDLYKELGQYGSRDESWDDVVARVLEHVDEEEALKDKQKRLTTHSKTDSTTQSRSSGNSTLKQLEDGTTLRHKYQQGNYSGNKAEARVVDGYIEVEGEKFDSPSPAAEKADRVVRGEDSAASLNGWEWWEYKNEHGNWVLIDRLRV